jgi:threonine dehydratase
VTTRTVIPPIPLEAIRAAAVRLRGVAVRTPLVRLELSGDGPEIWLKLENLQPIGSFKIRGAGNALGVAAPDTLARGVYTASAGNMAQGVAWCARRLGVRCQVIVPEHAPRTKREAIERLGGEAIPVSFEMWWQTMMAHSYPGLHGLFVHPVADPAVIAGNGTIGLEILEDLPDVDAVLVPFGGGGLSSGIACATRELAPRVKVFACEVETAAPFSASLAAGEATTVDRVPSFIDGIGGKGVLEEMWPLVSSVLAGSLVVSVAQIAQAVRTLAERARIVAEGAGAAPLAALLAHRPDARRVVCVVSGGNIDTGTLATILRGDIP